MAEAETSSKQLEPSLDPRQKATLFSFIEKTSKLVTSFAALIALTLFCIQQMKGGGIETVLPGMTLAAAILVGLEWWAQLPAPPYQWRLELFRELLAAILVFTAGYWFVKFGALYVNVSIFALLSFALMALAAAISAVFIYILRLKKQGVRRISYVVASLIVLYFAWSTVVRHLIKIPLPNPRAIFSRYIQGVFMTAVAWTIVGIVVSLLGIYFAQKIGFIQIKLMREANKLNLLRATPKVGTGITVDEQYDNGKAFPPFIYLTTTIYNEGELPINQLSGYWKLLFPQGLQDLAIPITRDVLGSSAPYELARFKISESGQSTQQTRTLDSMFRLIFVTLVRQTIRRIATAQNISLTPKAVRW